MSGVFPFSLLFLLTPCGVLKKRKRLGPTNSGPVHVAQKPFSSSAPRVTTWINATSIGICNRDASTPPLGRASLAPPHPPTPCFFDPLGGMKTRAKGIGSTVCDIHFRGPTIRQGSCNTLIDGCLLLGTPTCCLNRWTLFMVSVPVHFVSLALRMVQPISP